jgi:hypothetical protein
VTPVKYTKTLAAASATGIALSQALAAAGNLTLNGADASGGVATLDTGRRVILTSAGNDSTLTWSLYGTNQQGNPISEQFAGGNAAAVSSAFDYLTVTRIAGSKAAAGNVEAGTSTTGSSPWFMPTFFITPFLLDVESFVTGAVTYNIEYTLDDYWSPPKGQAFPVAPKVVQTTVSGATTNSSLLLTNPFRGWRVTVTSGTGSVLVEAQQAGIANF